MDWEATAAIAELLAAAGVIVSLVYLATQIRQNTRTERARAFQEIFSGSASFADQMFSPQNIELVTSGMLDFKALSGGDKLRFDNMMLGYFNAVEATIFSRDAFLLGDETLENWGHLLRTRMLPYAGVRDWWNEAKAVFAPETRAWIDQQISATDTSSDFLGLR
jgi:hypothetical protein